MPEPARHCRRRCCTRPPPADSTAQDRQADVDAVRAPSRSGQRRADCQDRADRLSGRDRIGVTMGDLPRVCFASEDHRHPQRRRDHLVAAGQPHVGPLERHDVAKISRGVSRQVLESQGPSSKFAAAATTACSTSARPIRGGPSGLTMDDEDASIRAALHRGASGYLLKDTTAAELHRALAAAADGQLTLSASVSARVPALVADRISASSDDRVRRVDLTARDRQLLDQLDRGRSNNEIARQLGSHPRRSATD